MQNGRNSNFWERLMTFWMLFKKTIVKVMVVNHTKSFESIPRDKGARHATDEQGNGIAIQ